jgi:uracil-DNA glycosylase
MRGNFSSDIRCRWARDWLNSGAVTNPLERHVTALRACTACPLMKRPAVSGGAVVSRIITVGQAPGSKEPVLGIPFAWTAGKTLFGWFKMFGGWTEADFRKRIYMAAVCRCFPGKDVHGGDRVPSAWEIARCSVWMQHEIQMLRPDLIIPIGKLAIAQFLPDAPLHERVGRTFHVQRYGETFDLIPLPHPSGASTWHRNDSGAALLAKAMNLIVKHPAWVAADRERQEAEEKTVARALARGRGLIEMPRVGRKQVPGLGAPRSK